MLGVAGVDRMAAMLLEEGYKWLDQEHEERTHEKRQANNQHGQRRSGYPIGEVMAKGNHKIGHQPSN